jgi:hypothetical protein
LAQTLWLFLPGRSAKPGVAVARRSLQLFGRFPLLLFTLAAGLARLPRSFLHTTIAVVTDAGTVLSLLNIQNAL